jgi:gamma-glutamyl hydrolase
MKTLNLCLLFAVATLFVTLQAKKPIIGIVSFYSEGWNGHGSKSWNYIAASYVKWLEAAGAEVVPIQWDQPFEQIDYLLDRLNGVVFTGGNIKILDDEGNPKSIYFTFQHITEYILKKNQNSHYYPLWGTCMGFWNIARALGNNTQVLTACKNCTYVKRDVFPETNYTSKMLKNLPKDLKAKIQTDELNVFLHWNMITPSVFQRKTLSKYWTPVAHSFDALSKEYVSMAESPKYPIYGTQFHPEKPEFEHNSTLTIPHSRDAIRFSQYLAKFFVAEAKKNRNTFPNNATYLFDNYSPYTLKNAEYEQVYFFPRYKAQRRLKGAF